MRLLSSVWFSVFLTTFWSMTLMVSSKAQCPHITNAELNQTDLNFCLGETLTFTAEGVDLPPGDVIDWYISQTMGFNPYENEGAYVGTSNISEVGGDTVVAPFVWTLPLDFCNTFEPGTYFVVGILNPPPSGGCMETFTDEFQIHISCPTASLTGDISICSENCPDDPGLITFDFSGGIEPYMVDVVVTASGFPPFQIPGLAFNATGEIYLCIGGFLPSYDPNTQTVTVPEFLIGQQVTITLQSITDDEGCVGEIIPPGQLQISLYESPVANAGNDHTICAGDFVSLSGTISGSAQSSEWITSGDGSFGNPFTLQTTYTPGLSDLDQGSVILTLIAFEPNDGCEPDSSSIEITILEAPQADAGADQTICNTESVQLSGSISGGATSGQWMTSGDGAFNNSMALDAIYFLGSDDILNGSVTLILTTDDVGGQCELGEDEMVVTLVAPPVISGPAFGSVCLGDLAFLPHVVNGNVGSILWSSSGDGIFDDPMSPSTFYIPGIQDTTNGQVILTLTATDATGICAPVEFEYTLTIFSCGCPPFVIEEPQDPICNLDGELVLSQLIIVSDPGTWQITATPPGINPAVINEDIFIATDADPGLYTVSYILDNPFPGCPVSVSITVEVIAMPDVDAGQDQQICSSDHVLLQGFATGDIGTILWTSSGMGVFSDPMSLNGMYTPDSADQDVGIITFVLTGSDSSAVCPTATDTMITTLSSPPVSILISDSTSVCNDSMFGSVVDLSTFVVNGDTTGAWSNLNGSFDLSDPGNVQFDNAVPSIYSFLYTSPLTPPCDPVSDTFTVEVLSCVCPQLVVNPLPSAVCNSSSGVELNAFLMASQPGMWHVTTTPAGSMPATLTGSFLNAIGADPGLYEVMFTFTDHVDGCPDSATLEITIAQVPGVNAGRDTTICSTEILQLSGSVNPPVSLLEWSTSGDGVFNDSSVLSTTYASGLLDNVNGIVVLTLVASDTSGVCPATSDELVLTLLNPPFALFDTSFVSVCNLPDSGSVVNLISLITSGDAGGSWLDVDGSGVDLSDPALVDFSGIQAGLYTFRYTTMSALSPCSEVSYDITIQVRDCACPDLTLVNVPDVLCNNDTLDLNTLLLVAQPGAWQVNNINNNPIPPVITNTIMSTNGASAGVYWLQFTLSDTVSGCPDLTGFSFSVESVPQYTVSEVQCQIADSAYSVTLITDAETVVSDTGIVDVVSNDTVRVRDIPLGENVLLKLTSVSGACAVDLEILSPDCSCSLQITQVPDSVTLCSGDTSEVLPVISGGNGNVNAYWVTPTDTVFELPIEAASNGLYTLFATDELGCEQVAMMTVLIKPEITATLIVADPSCPGTSDGSIEIVTITGADQPVLYALDGGMYLPVNALPVLIPDLSAGTYILQVQDGDGCENEFPVSISAPAVEVLSLGTDITVDLGDSVFISPVISFIPTSFNYTPQLLQELEGWISPIQNGVLTLQAVDTNGCTYADSMRITVRVVEQMFAPNVFSPNGDQINDQWTLYSSDRGASIQVLNIYDRWGGLIFSISDIPVNEPSIGWDGGSNGSEMHPGVYVFQALVLMSNGEIKQVGGDITLVK